MCNLGWRTAGAAIAVIGVWSARADAEPAPLPPPPPAPPGEVSGQREWSQSGMQPVPQSVHRPRRAAEVDYVPVDPPPPPPPPAAKSTAWATRSIRPTRGPESRPLSPPARAIVASCCDRENTNSGLNGNGHHARRIS